MGGPGTRTGAAKPQEASARQFLGRLGVKCQTDVQQQPLSGYAAPGSRTWATLRDSCAL